jgi:hypothetical protein
MDQVLSGDHLTSCAQASCPAIHTSSLAQCSREGVHYETLEYVWRQGGNGLRLNWHALSQSARQICFTRHYSQLLLPSCLYIAVLH